MIHKDQCINLHLSPATHVKIFEYGVKLNLQNVNCMLSNSFPVPLCSLEGYSSKFRIGVCRTKKRKLIQITLFKAKTRKMTPYTKEKRKLRMT